MFENTITTDAVPDPPRDENISKPTGEIHNSENLTSNGKSERSTGNEENTEKDSSNTEEEQGSCSSHKQKSSKTKKQKKYVGHQGNKFHLSISESNNVHIGNNITYNMNYVRKSEEDVKTVRIRKLMQSRILMDKKVVDCASKHISKNWRNVGAALEYTVGQLDQFYEDHMKDGLKEVIYQMLLDWIQMYPDSTVGTFASVLWDCGEKNCLGKLLELECFAEL